MKRIFGIALGIVLLAIGAHAQGNLPATIRTAPIGVDVHQGATVNLHVVAGGSAPFTYQWAKGGATLAGATTDTLTLRSVTVADAGNYTVTVANTLGSDTSNPATVTVRVPSDVTVVTQPQSQTVLDGAAVLLQVVAGGTPPFAYQWWKDGTNLVGAIYDTLAFPAVNTNFTGVYSVTVSNSWGGLISAPATLIVNPAAATVVTNPASVTVYSGNTANFSVLVGGTPPFTFQWLKDGTNLAGAVLSSLAVTAITNVSAGAYTVAVSNAWGGQVSAPAMLNILPPGPAVITNQPAGTNVVEGTAVYLQVLADGTLPYTFQWYQDGIAVSGGSTYTLNFLSIITNYSGIYTVAVSNAYGGMVSDPVAVIVHSATPRTVRLNGFVSGEAGRLTAPIELAAQGNEASVAFTVAWDPSHLNYGDVISRLDLNDTNVVNPGTNAVGTTPDYVVPVLNTNRLAEGRIGITLALPGGRSLQAATNRLVEVNWTLAPGLTGADAGFALLEDPVPTRVLDVTGNVQPVNAAILPVVEVSSTPPVLEPQSALFLQTLTVINPGVSNLADARISIGGLGVDSLTNAILAWNASGFAGTNPFVQPGPIPAAGHVDLTMEYYVSDRTTLPHPVYEAQVGAPNGLTAVNPAWFKVEKIVFTGNEAVLTFNSVSGATYYVQYLNTHTGPDGVTVTDADWSTALPGILGQGNFMQWIDNGPPKTSSRPADATSRWYRMIRR